MKSKEIKLPPAPEIITKRPAGMPFDEYKRRRTTSNKLIRDRIRYGFPKK